MLRRRKDDKLNGKVLIELPQRNLNIVSCDFSPSEQQFYDDLEAKMGTVRDQLMAEAERAGKNTSYMAMLLLLLRLRQGQFVFLSYFHYSQSIFRMAQLATTLVSSQRITSKTSRQSTLKDQRKLQMM